MEAKSYLPIEVLHDFVEKIESLGIAYMLTGSMAMMNYSVYRFTADVDVVLELETEHAQRIIEIFEPDYYVPHNSARRAMASRGMFNVIHRKTAFKIDCIVRKSDDFQKSVFARRVQTDFYGRKISIITKEDLIISKLWWAKDSRSEKQLTDVKNLLRAGYDEDYIKKWTPVLRVDDLFEQCRKAIEI